MENIEYYIEESKNRRNTSDGGSPAYHFDDVVLVKYEMSSKYGLSRDGEELVARAANRLNDKGVRTPKHLAIKRENIGEENICWVLQERAKGEAFTKYSDIYSQDVKKHLEKQYVLVSAPNSHYEKLVSDMCALFNMGVEPKPKKIYYDSSPNNGGFTIIDLLYYDDNPIDYNSLEQVRLLFNYLRAIINSTTIVYNKYATSEQLATSKFYRFMMINRLIQAMKKVMPNFEQHRRWILRNLADDEIVFLQSNGFLNEDLSLSDEEEMLFDKMIEMIVNDALEKVKKGELKYWQVMANELRIKLESYTLNGSYSFSKKNEFNLEEFESMFDYQDAIKDKLQRELEDKFDKRLAALADTDNPFINEAIQDMSKNKVRRSI